MAKKFYRLNQYIRAPKVRVVDEKGKQVGVISTVEALKQAQEKGLDLVEVAPNTKPPVCKLINFKKFRFQESKKHQSGQKKAKKIETKEFRFRPFIAENDFGFRMKRAEEFLKEGNSVKLVVRFRGRQITKKSFGYDLLKKAVKILNPVSEVASEPRFRGRQLEMTLKPYKKSKDGQKSEKTKNQKVSQKKI